jgi:hypothetical protein
MSNDLKQIATLAPGVLPDELSPAQGQALAELLQGRPVTVAAKAANVSRVTVWRWRTEHPAFIAAYNSLQAEMLASTRQSLLMQASLATATMRRLMTRRSVPDSVKFAAAAFVLRSAEGMTEQNADPDEIENDLVKAKASKNLRIQMRESTKRREKTLKDLDREIAQRQAAKTEGDE